MSLPTDHQERKGIPLGSFLTGYFPDAFIELAKLSKKANDQHNPGEPMHWAREKSADHADCAIRHYMEHGKRDKDGERHTAKAAWRMMAMLQLEIEQDRKEQAAIYVPAKHVTIGPVENPIGKLQEIANRYVPGERQGIYGWSERSLGAQPAVVGK